ncbi:MAG: dihydroneopterin aldolase [Elusimicrobiota bacterium]
MSLYKMAQEDKIWLLGVECRTRIGVPIEERRRPQIVRVDAGLESRIDSASRKDDISLAVDYQKAERAIRELAAKRPRRLVETLADDISSALLDLDRRIRAVVVRVHKRPAAMPKTGEVVVEIRRAREKKGNPRR